MKQYSTKNRSRKGMAMLVVLFIVMAIAVISSGFLARSDAQLQCGRNLLLRNEADYLAWAGLEHAKALVISPENAEALNSSFSQTRMQLDAASTGYYDLTMESPVVTAAADPNAPSTYTYSVQSTAYDESNGNVRARSVLNATLFYDPNSVEAYYLSVTRQ